MDYKAALVTGGARRLGRAMAMALATRGTAVAVHYNGSDAEARATVDEIVGIGGLAVTVKADLLNEVETEALVPGAAEALGLPLDVLINNASIFEYDRIETATSEGWNRHMMSNLRAPFILSQRFAEQAPKAKLDEAHEKHAQSIIINMVDQRVRKMTPEFMTYSLAKAGLWTLTQTSARALAPHIRVNAIGPGPTLQGARQSKQHFENQRAATILERGADEQDIVQAMEYFLDAKAVTGQLLCVDGGQHLGWKTPDIQGVE